MVKFNPDVPNSQAESFLGYSKPIENYTGDTSKGIALKGIGEVLGGSVKAADEIVKDNIQDQVYAKADTNRQIYTADLEAVKAGEIPAGGPLNIIPTNGASAPAGVIPQEVATGVDRAENLVSARANGKVSPTYYWGRMNELAKSLRAQYPGYREYIDQQFSSITGANPANAYITALSQDINAAQTSATSAKSKINAGFFDNDVMGYQGDPKTGVPGASVAHQLWQNGQWTDDQAYAWQTRIKTVKAAAEASTANMTLYKNNKEFIASEQGKNADADAMLAVSSSLDTVTAPNGGNAKQIVQDVLSGKTPADDAKMQALAPLMQSARQQAYAQTWAKWNTVDPTTKTKMVDDLGGSTAARTRLDGIFKNYDDVINNITNKEFGAAYMQKNFVAAKIEGGQAQFLTNEDTKDFAIKLAVIQKLAGPNYVKDFFTSVLGTDVPAKLQAYFDSKVLDLHTQYDPATGAPTAPSSPPKTTFDAVIKGGMDKGIGKPDKGSNADEAGKFNQGILQRINTLTSKASDEEKINIAKAAFSSQGRDLLNNFVRDNVDPKTGVKQPGYYTVFQMFTNPAVTSEMKRLGEKNPDLWRDYKDAANTWFGRVLFRNDIENFKQITAQDNLKVTWNAKDAEFTAKPIFDNKYPTKIGNLTQIDMLHINSSLRDLNLGIRNMKNIADQDKSDINAYVLQQFADNGVDFKNIPTSLTGAMLKALISGNVPADKSSIANYTQEYGPISGLLNDWLANPTRKPPPEDKNKDKNKDQSRAGQ